MLKRDTARQSFQALLFRLRKSLGLIPVLLKNQLENCEPLANPSSLAMAEIFPTLASFALASARRKSSSQRCGVIAFSHWECPS